MGEKFYSISSSDPESSEKSLQAVSFYWTQPTKTGAWLAHNSDLQERLSSKSSVIVSPAPSVVKAEVCDTYKLQVH